MEQKKSSCYRYVGETEICSYCSGNCIKHGSYNGRQRYKCKSCGRTFIKSYQYNACKPGISLWIQKLLKEGCGIRSIGRLLQISVTTVLKRIISIAKAIRKPMPALHKTYEVDEMRTFYKSKGRKLWIVYALQNDTGQVADFAVGARTVNTLQRVINTLILSGADKIKTDRLPLYRQIIPHSLHERKAYNTNHIERKNLSLRTCLKRLSRRTICYSKSLTLLTACLKIYFWK